MLSRLLAAPRSRALTVGSVFLAGIAITLVCGTLRNSEEFLFDYDARFWFLGGVMWLRGDSPYAAGPFLRLWNETFGVPPRFRAAFVYPGTILPLSVVLGAFKWETARWVMRALNFAAYAGSLLALRGAFVRGETPGPSRSERDIWIGVSAAVPGVALTMYQGQMSLLVTAGICLAWAGFRSGRTPFVTAGIFLASMKPQISVVAVLFLLARFRDRRAWPGIVLTALVAASVLVWPAQSGFVADLKGSLAEHTAQGFNRPDQYDSLVARFGTGDLGRALQWAGLLGACAAAVVLGGSARRSRLPHAEIRLFQIVLAITAVAVPVHRYDLAIHLPLVATAWALGSGWRGACLFFLVMVHGWATWICWHVDTALGLELDYHVIAGYVAAAELVLLAVWWRRDSDVPGEPERGAAVA